MIDREILKAMIAGNDKAPNLDMTIDMGMKVATDLGKSVSHNIGVMAAGGMNSRDIALALMIGVEMHRTLIRTKDPKMTEVMDSIGELVDRTVASIMAEKKAAASNG